MRALGWPGLATVGALMFVVRPLNVLAGTLGTDVTWRERLFLFWLAPRGIVAAAVASFFAVALDNAGIAGGSELRAEYVRVNTATYTHYDPLTVAAHEGWPVGHWIGGLFGRQGRGQSQNQGQGQAQPKGKTEQQRIISQELRQKTNRWTTWGRWKSGSPLTIYQQKTL